MISYDTVKDTEAVMAPATKALKQQAESRCPPLPGTLNRLLSPLACSFSFARHRTTTKNVKEQEGLTGSGNSISHQSHSYIYQGVT